MEDMSEDDDFGDFQACQTSDTNTPFNSNDHDQQTHKDDDFYQPLPNVNAFELNSSDFDDFLRYFDKIICDSFPISEKFTLNSIIHSQEDSIDDCP